MRIIELFKAGEPARHRPPAMHRRSLHPNRIYPAINGLDLSLVQDRPRQRSFEPAPRKARIGLGRLLPGHPSPVATTARFRDHSARHVISGRILNARVEIPIEPAATRPTSRGFLPEGFRTTAPVPVDRPVRGPSSETLYNCGGAGSSALRQLKLNKRT
jgi:hypothetical protein